jgi:hypothetical protein
VRHLGASIGWHYDARISGLRWRNPLAQSAGAIRWRNPLAQSAGLTRDLGAAAGGELDRDSRVVLVGTGLPLGSKSSVAEQPPVVVLMASRQVARQRDENAPGYLNGHANGGKTRSRR